MKTLLSALAVILLTLTPAHAQQPTGRTPLFYLTSLLDQYHIPWTVVSAFDRANSTSGSLSQVQFSLIFSNSFPAQILTNAYWLHQATNGYVAEDNDWYDSYQSAYPEPVMTNAATGQAVSLGLKATGAYKNIQILPDGSQFLFFDNQGYTYKIDNVTSYNQDSSGNGFAYVSLVPHNQR